MSLRTVDLFCGCGGLSLGLKKAGLNVVLGADSCEETMTVYRRNNVDHPGITQDLSVFRSTLKMVEFFEPDLIAGGPPCQDYSAAGNRTEGAQASMTIEFAGVVRYMRPKVFIMENVTPAERSETYQRAGEIFRKEGYGLTQRVLDASLCGVPQKRQRLFVVGALGEEDGWLNETIDKRLADEPMTIRDYMGDELDIEYYYRHPRTYGRRGVYSIDEPSATIRGVNRQPSPTYKKHPADLVSVKRKKVRALSPQERSRVQTFPKDFVWPDDISKTKLEQMIGNAVPVELGAFVGSCVIEALGLGVIDQPGRKAKKSARLVSVDGKVLEAA